MISAMISSIDFTGLFYFSTGTGRVKTSTKYFLHHLKGHWEEFSSFRELLKVLCQKEIKDIEGIPKLLRRLEGNEGPWQ